MYLSGSSCVGMAPFIYSLPEGRGPNALCQTLARTPQQTQNPAAEGGRGAGFKAQVVARHSVEHFQNYL